MTGTEQSHDGQAAPEGFGPPPPPFDPSPPAAPFQPPGPPTPFQPAGPASPPPLAAVPPAPVPPSYPSVAAAPPDGPEFLAADADNGVAVGPEGVHFAQGVYAADFPWPQLQTVQFRPMGAHLCVAAVLLDGRMFECRVKARRTSVLQTWCGELGGVLHHYLSARPH